MLFRFTNFKLLSQAPFNLFCNQFYVSPLPTVPAGSPPPGGDAAVHVFDINQPSLPTPFYSLLVSTSVFMALSTVFHSMNSPDNSPLSHFVLAVSFLLIGPVNYMSLYENLLQP